MSSSSDRSHRIDLRAIFAVIRRIPRGKVATYGEVAALAGASNPRHVGRALRALTEDHDVPWQRVVNAAGKVSERTRPGNDDWQRILLEREGIGFDGNGRIDMGRHRWDPEEGRR